MDLRASPARKASTPPAKQPAKKNSRPASEGPKKEPHAGAQKKDRGREPQSAKATPLAAGATAPLLTPKLELAPSTSSAPMNLSPQWNQAKDWVIGTVKAASDALSPDPNNGGPPPKVENTEKKSNTLEAETNRKRHWKRFGVKPENWGHYDKGVRSPEIPSTFLTQDGTLLSSYNVYTKYQLARRYVLGEAMPGYFRGKHHYTPDQVNKSEEEAISYFANEIGELRPIVDDLLQDAIDLPSLIREMNQIVTTDQKAKIDRHVRSYTASVNELKTPYSPGAKSGTRPVGTIQSIYQGDKALDWKVLQRAVMGLILKAPPNTPPSFVALDQNLRDALGITNPDQMVLVKSSNQMSLWRTTYQRLLDYAIKPNALYVLDYPYIKSAAVDEMKILGMNAPPFPKAPKQVTLEELTSPLQ